jgi:phosphoglycolate phosphatase
MLYPSFTESEVAALKEMYSRCFVSADQKPCEFYPNVLTTLEKLQGEHTLAVATGKSRRGLSRVLGNLAMERNFVATRCADETASKPDPLMLEELLAETGFSAADAVMVGDTEYDLEMAQRAGMASIGVAYGAHSVERLLKWDPIAVLQDFKEIEAVLLALNSARARSA